ncbi:hypothetical protein HYDPIDRAFT_171012 [Hydnomerulius pinastri MD-312]|uniref:Uncharacterized protein n=1 Tax=Hydnomerulius pinastri MD-312 TaxID=994086 RepID=A0A0C9W7W3_9AGAM|nr:hypothetical protein HYDPIDRAFT_171012 [Hydnomerulius pinastri MD-312]
MCAYTKECAANFSIDPRWTYDEVDTYLQETVFPSHLDMYSSAENVWRVEVSESLSVKGIERWLKKTNPRVWTLSNIVKGKNVPFKMHLPLLHSLQLSHHMCSWHGTLAFDESDPITINDWPSTEDENNMDGSNTPVSTFKYNLANLKHSRDIAGILSDSGPTAKKIKEEETDMIAGSSQLGQKHEQLLFTGTFVLSFSSDLKASIKAMSFLPSQSLNSTGSVFTGFQSIHSTTPPVQHLDQAHNSMFGSLPNTFPWTSIEPMVVEPSMHNVYIRGHKDLDAQDYFIRSINI